MIICISQRVSNRDITRVSRSGASYEAHAIGLPMIMPQPRHSLLASSRLQAA